MKISLDWIKEFTDIPSDITPQELGMKFTLSTCEVEGVEETNKHLEEVTVAEITAIEPHPEADRLNLVTFESGTGDKRVVCGAPNVKVGLKVPFAPIGTTLPGGFTLEPKKIRGILSEGMLCAEDELGLGEGHEGLLVLPADAAVGTTMAELLNLKKDVLLDIDNKSITHRPDLWGHYGMAREFAAVFQNPLKKPFGQEWMERMRGYFTSDASPVAVEVEKGCACLGYFGLSVDNVTIKSSPSWMQQRLIACGLRPINNIVDISNYVMLELGQPNHLFDRDTIRGGKIIVREMGEEINFTTLDEMERHILPGDTMVCDAEGPSVIGGIMGGLSSSVKESTTRVFIEAANWVDARVRHISTRLGLRTDSSQRYEKSLDTNQLERAVLRILELVLESCPDAKVVGKIESDGVIPTPELNISLSPRRVNSVLGTELNAEEIKSFLELLEFEVEPQAGVLMVRVPSFRATKDIEVDADLIEEVGRIYGYDKLVPQAPMNEISAVNLTQSKRMHRKILDLMVYRGRALEVYTYPMVGAKLLDQALWPEKNETLVLANPISPEHDRMRPSMIPSLIESAALNQKNWSSFRMFEVGRSYKEDEKAFSHEKSQLGIVFYDRKNSPFLELANTLEDLMKSLNLPYRIVSVYNAQNPLLPEDWPGRHPSDYLDVQVMGKSCGFITSVHPLVCRNFKIKGNLVLAMLDLTDFQDRELKDKTKYHPLSRFPSSIFDCTVIADTRTPVETVVKALGKLKLKELDWVKIIDVFQLSEEQKAVTVRTSFSDQEKTLSGEFIRDAENMVIETLRDAGYPLKTV